MLTQSAAPPPFSPSESTPLAVSLVINGESLVADHGGVLVWPDERTLIVADLHFEKGSAFAARRQPVPPYDTAATLAALLRAIVRHAPRRVIALGDSFHDMGGLVRMSAPDREGLRALQTSRDWLWVAGNHDPAPPDGFGGEACSETTIRGLTFRHEPSPGPAAGEIAGHLHPVAVVAGSGGAVRRRCFVADATRCILPAFGAYAGGLNFRDAAFSAAFPRAPHAIHVLGRQRIYSVPAHRCL